MRLGEDNEYRVLVSSRITGQSARHAVAILRDLMVGCVRRTYTGLKSLFGLLNAAADSENVPVRVADVHLAGVPRHVGRRPGDIEALLNAALVNHVNVVNP